ncbi:MAG TPA: pilus assembly protein N-terminal domain-containing protein [Victivallales bacterium]|nr:pilus assembly protein N-terminal domain-containing protein [Victivallales bacterium]
MNGRNLLFAILFFVTTALFSEDAIKGREIEVKEGARTIVRLSDISTFLVKDPEIAGVAKTERNDEIVVVGQKMGNAGIVCQNTDGTRTSIAIKVVPKYWDTLLLLFEDNPNIRMTITNEHLILSGEASDQDTMKKVKMAVELDKTRIINNVNFSRQNLLEKIQSHLKTSGLKDVTPSIQDNIVYLTGMLLDKDKEKDLISVVKSYADNYGCSINSSGLKTGGPPLIVEVKFVSLAKGNDNNMGLIMDDIKYNLNWNPKETEVWQFDNHVKSTQETESWELDGEVTTSGTVKLQKVKSSLKVLYESRMSTISGEKVKMQRGGTIYLQTTGVEVADVQEVDYGFMVEIVPTILGGESVAADVDVQVSGVQSNSPLTINKYTLNAKYVVSPGEIILVNKMNILNDKLMKQGVPFLSDIPLLGYAFQNTQENDENANVLLLLRISSFDKTILTDEGKKAQEKFEKIKKNEHSNVFEDTDPIGDTEEYTEEKAGTTK